ncbi:MAG: porin [Burkholderiaceae bacterium]
MHIDKKTLLAACVAAALPAAAGAQTKLYGVFDAFAGYQKTNVGSRTLIDAGGMQTSYWGVSGSEDLGGGLKAVFALEGFLRNDTGETGRYSGDGFFSRSSYVGLDGGFGTVTLGRNTAPYFLSTILFNPFVDSFTFSPMVLHTFISGGSSYTFVNGDTGLSNSVRWRSPVWGGFRLDAAYSLGAENNVEPKRARRDLDVSAFYSGGAFSATIAYRGLNQDTDTVSAKQTSVQAGAAYDLKVVKLFAQYQRSKSEASGPEQLAKTYQVGASVPVGAGKVLASFASSKYEASGGATLPSGDKRTNWALGYDYPLSKRTDVYAAYSNQKFRNPETYSRIFGVGVRHAF